MTSARLVRHSESRKAEQWIDQAGNDGRRSEREGEASRPMSLKDDKQRNIQLELDFSSAPTGEAREPGREETESSGATSEPENPASTNRWMEAVCERENLKAALRQVRANQGSPGVDGMTVVGLKDHLKQHWSAIREQLLLSLIHI